MADTDIEHRLREAGSEFIGSHGRAEAAIREAATAGMSAEMIADASGLSAETVSAFLRASMKG